MAIYYSTNPLDHVAVDGVYVSETAKPGGAKLVGTNETHIVGDFPWGEPDTVQTFSDPQKFQEAMLAQVSNPEEWPGVRSILNKQFGVIKVVRIDATGAVAASRTVDADGYTATAKYKGAAGNEIQIKHTDKTGGAFDVEVKWGGYTKKYAGRTLADVADIEDEYVDFATSGAGDTVAASDADFVSLAAGANGTAVDADYLGGASDVSGLRLLRNEKDGAVVFLAEYTSTAAIAALRDHVAVKRGYAVAQADAGDFAANIAVAEGINDERLSLCSHRVKQMVNNVKKTVDLAPFVASMLSQIPPHYSIADQDYAAALLGAILEPADGVELGRANAISANDAGALMLEPMQAGGYRFVANLTTSTVAGKELISSRRVIDIANATVAQAIAPFQSKPNMSYFKTLVLSGAKNAIRLLKGSPDTRPETAIVADGGAQLVSTAIANSSAVQVAWDLHGEIRYLILYTISGIDLNVEEYITE